MWFVSHIEFFVYEISIIFFNYSFLNVFLWHTATQQHHFLSSQYYLYFMQCKRLRHL